MASQQFGTTPGPYDDEAVVVGIPVDPIPPKNLNFLQQFALSMPWPVHIVYFCVAAVVTWWLFSWMIWWASPTELCAQWATPVSSA